MAKKTGDDGLNTQSLSSVENNRFDKNLQKDIRDFHLEDTQWTFARNAINNSNLGDLGKLGNEPANKLCVTAPYTIIGFIHLVQDKWAVFSTDNTHSEIGYFQESTCTYVKIVNDDCLGFSTEHLIYGISRLDAECNHVIYWSDGYNVDRYMQIGDMKTAPYSDPWPGVPYVCQGYDPVNTPDCVPCVFATPLALDCNKVRLETLMKPICFNVTKGALGGALQNGSYFVTAAYTVDGLRVTDYFTPSNVQALFDHTGTGGSLEILIEDIDTNNFEEFELVVIYIVAEQTMARRVGIYSTRQTMITLDTIDNQLPSVPLEQITAMNIIYEKSDAMYEVNDYLLRIGPTSKFSFNYQPLANQIRVKWQSVEYPEDYYLNGGNNTGYMRDEVYSFFIRWVYNTGDKSSSFHIPGRPKKVSNDAPGSPNIDFGYELYNDGSPILAPIDDDNIETTLGELNVPVWRVRNTAGPVTLVSPYLLCDKGVVIAEGYMGYWESTEKYPDTKPSIWNSSSHDWSSLTPPSPNPAPQFPYLDTTVNDYDLCGKNIRHHRFPDNDLDQSVSHFRPAGQAPAPGSLTGINHIRILGVSFENIRPPVDNQGNLIPGVIGYEILRGSRKGNRSVVAKGIINNMVQYNPVINGSTQIGLFQNYPYNDLRGDKFLSKTPTRTNGVSVSSPLEFTPFTPSDYRKDIFSFHSPETNFTNPYLSPIELKVYQDISGTASMRYQYPARHPKHVFPKDLALFMSLIGGIGLALYATKGKKSKTQKLGATSLLSSSSVGPVVGPNPAIFAAAYAAAAGVSGGALASLTGYNLSPAALLESLLGTGDQTASAYSGILAGLIGGSAGAALHGEFTVPQVSSDYGQNDYIPLLLNVVSTFLPGSLPMFFYFFSEGAEQLYRFITNAGTPQQHALQMISACLYNDFSQRPFGQRRRIIRNSGYVDNQIHDFGTNYKINNLNRGRFVALELTNTLAEPAVVDETRYDTRLQDLPGGINIYKKPERGFTKLSSTYYSALKQRFRNQYGQLESIVELPIGCMRNICPPSGLRTSYSIPDGYGFRLTNAPLICDGNLVTNPQFSDNSGNSVFTDWQSYPLMVWQNNIVSGQNAASNNGPGLLVQPDAFPELIQVFPTPLPNGKPLRLSFNLLELPSGYEMKVYIGTTASEILTVAAPGQYVTPVAPVILTPSVGTNDRIRFVTIPPSSSTPLTITAEVQSYGPIGSLQRMWFVPKFQNIGSDPRNYFSTGNYFLLEPPTPLSPSLYSNGPDNYITNLACPTRITWNISLDAKRLGFLDSSIAVTLRRLVPLLPSGDPGIEEALILTSVTPPFSPATYSSTGSVIIQNPDPDDKYVLFFNSEGVQYTVNGFSVTVDACVQQESVSITDICLTLPPTGQGYGCTDPDAVNYDPNATTDNGTCVYYGCTDPNALNYCDTCISCPPTVDNSDCDCIYANTDPGGPPVPAGDNCNHPCSPVTVNPRSYDSDVMFGGDIYVNRYTEKNSFFYFFDWMYGQPDRYEWDYQKYRMIPYPTYWFNSQGMSVLESIGSAFDAITDPGNWSSNLFDTIITPSDYHCFDRPNAQFGLIIKLGYIYLFNSGIRQFFVESEYNVDLRDFGDNVTQRHYQALGRDSYTDTSAMFEPQVIKAGNYYRYDNSLSISKIWFSYVSWGTVYPRSYDPLVAETCYQYNPNRIIYSLPLQTGVLRDNWRIFLSNNYKDFLSKVMVVKQINKSGALILFESDSPVMFQGTDQLQTDLGTKLTIGDGGLFSQPMQSLMNADRAYEYGSCQNRLSVINTPVGTFWMNQNQGKIFYFGSSLEEISMANLKWWLAQFLPYQLIKYYPDYRLTDNTVAGIGCQTMYDNTNNLLYFTKKDYKPKLDNNGKPLALYDADANEFYVKVGTMDIPVSLGDLDYFESASWTISYDVKIKGWVSFHDWHPDLSAAGKNTFMTTKDDGIWVHNQRCDLYVNYYGTNYPFEVEYMANTVQNVNTLRSIEYQLEVYKYKYENCYDRFHVLDYNFDEAVIYNTEQCSGLLKLNLTPKNNAPLLTQFPQVNPTNIQILYSKEENKYRFNQFWDTTKDRAEFAWSAANITPTNPSGQLPVPDPTLPVPGGAPQPGNFRQQTIWDTQSNGYIRTLNAFNLNYNKSQLERKKFRHYTTSVLLRRKVSGNKKMLVSITNNKNTFSPR